MWYKVDFVKLSQLLLPVGLRKPKLLAFINALLQPIATIHTQWSLFRNDTPWGSIYKLNHNGQVCYLRAALNDAFDVSERRIYIDGTGGDASKTYIYTPGEEQTKYLGKLWLRNSLEFADTGADFLVYVPQSIIAQKTFDIRAMLDFYKVASKRYLIIPI